MSFLGQPYRVVYEAKNFKTGLVGVTAKVKRPDGVVIGAFALTEFAEAEFKGMYFFDLLTVLADPVGEWIGVVTSGTHKAGFRVSYQPPFSQITNIFIGDNALKAHIESDDVLGKVQSEQNIVTGVVDQNRTLTATVKQDETKGTSGGGDSTKGNIDDDSVSGQIEEC